MCTGCGHELQFEYPERPGFTPESALTKESPLCRRCYRIRHYGEFTQVAVTDETYESQVSRIQKQPGIVLYVLDVFDIEGSLVRNLSKFVAGSRVMLVVNKVDVLPPEVNFEGLSAWIRGVVENTRVPIENIYFVSAESALGVGKLTAFLDANRTTPVYVVGMANVGKSTLLNQLLKSQGKRDVFTASRMPGTTLGLARMEVEMPSGWTCTFIDTPGLIHGDRLTDKLCADCLKSAVPSTRLKPRVFQLDANQSLWFGGLARFDFASGVHQPVVCYVSNALPIHRTKLERADYIGAQHADDILHVPCASCRLGIGELCPHSVGMQKHRLSTQTSFLRYERRGADLVIPGLGWIALFGMELRGTLWIPKGIAPLVRPRLIGEISRQKA